MTPAASGASVPPTSAPSASVAGGADPLVHEVCTTSEAARLLGVSNTTVQQMVERGELRGWKTRGGHRRIDRASIEAVRVARSAGPAGSGVAATVLVVEDDPRARDRIAAAAARWPAAVRLLWAGDAFDALVAVERHRPDLMVTDLRATPIDGLEFLRRLRAVPEYRSMAILVSTELDDADLASRGGLPPGAVRHGRPVPLDTLQGFVEACVLRRQMSAR